MKYEFPPWCFDASCLGLMQNFVLVQVDVVYSHDSLCLPNSVVCTDGFCEAKWAHTRLRSSRARIFKELEFLVASGIKSTGR